MNNPFDLIRPTLLLDKEQCIANVKMMLAKAQRSNVKFRPHFKTHQSAQVGEWIRDLGVDAITVSSVKMMKFFVDNDWTDITVAFPMNVHEAVVINRVPTSTTVNLTVLSAEVVKALDARLTRPVELFIKIDTGYNRTGIKAEDKTAIDQVLAAIDTGKNVSFRGFLAHAGHSYKAKSDTEVADIHNTTMHLMRELKEQYVSRYPNLELSIGDTPTCSVMDDFSGMTEIRPGNFVFYDAMMHHNNFCTFEEIAVCMAVPVVAVHPDQLKVIFHGGGVHFSKDVLQDENGNPMFGHVVQIDKDGWSTPLKGWRVAALSQEHGTLVADSAETLSQIQIGDFVGIIPVHSCLTADAMKGYYTLDRECVDHLEGGTPNQ